MSKEPEPTQEPTQEPAPNVFIPDPKLLEQVEAPTTTETEETPAEDQDEKAEKEAEAQRIKEAAERVSYLRTLTEELAMELANPTEIENHHVTDVIGEYTHSYLVTPFEYEISVWEGTKEEKIPLHGRLVDAQLADTHKLRIGYMPHIFEREPLPVFLLVSSKALAHLGFTAYDVTKAFKAEDFKDIQKAISAYTIRLVGASWLDLAREAASAWEVANERAMDSKTHAQLLLLRLLRLKQMEHKAMGGLGLVPWRVRFTEFVGRHKKGIAIFFFFLFLAIAAGAYLWFMMGQAARMVQPELLRYFGVI